MIGFKKLTQKIVNKFSNSINAGISNSRTVFPESFSWKLFLKGLSEFTSCNLCNWERWFLDTYWCLSWRRCRLMSQKCRWVPSSCAAAAQWLSACRCAAAGTSHTSTRLGCWTCRSPCNPHAAKPCKQTHPLCNHLNRKILTVS